MSYCAFLFSILRSKQKTGLRVTNLLESVANEYSMSLNQCVHSMAAGLEGLAGYLARSHPDETLALVLVVAEVGPAVHLVFALGHAHQA